MDKKKLGIWLDHATANLIALKSTLTSQTIKSDFTHDKKVEALQKNENLMHNKEQQFHEAYYQKIGDENCEV